MAAEGKNEVARNLLDLQPTAVLEFFQLILKDPNQEKEEKLFFHGGSIFSESLIWQTNQYFPIAVESEGFEVLGDRRLPRPKLRVANRDFLVTALLQKYNDFINAKVIRKKVFVRNLDDANFDGGNPWGAANPSAEISSETWFVGRKAAESKLFVELELNSPLDLESFNVNDRAVVSKYCSWQYRGLGCRYAGLPVETEDEKPFINATGGVVTPTYRPPNDSSVDFWYSSDAEWNANKTYIAGDIVWVSGNAGGMPPLDFVGNRPEAGIGSEPTEPYKTVYVCVSGNDGEFPNQNPSFWIKDGCAKSLGACRKRFNIDNQFTYVRETLNDTPTGFNTIKFSGNKSISEGDWTDGNGSSAGLFYSVAPIVTGSLAGAFTVAGWVSGNDASSQMSAILSTTSRGEDSAALSNTKLNDFFNLARANDGLPSSQGQVQFNYLTKPNGEEKVDYNLGELDAGWTFFVISNEGPTTSNPDYVDTSSPTRFEVIRRNNGPSETYLFMKFRLSTNFDYRNDNDKVPKHFMLGAMPVTLASIPQSGFHPTMNGAIGPWALWNRTLTEKEKDFLYRGINTPAPDTIDFIPRNYYECTGDFAAVTGDSLVAWWDMSTGQPSAGETGLKDIHTGNNWLTGSGTFGTGDISVTRNDEITISNPSFFYPRFGGFPGTDGFGY